MNAKSLLKPSLDWLLVFVPITAFLHHTAPESHTAVFICACLAILPLAGWLGHATEHLAAKTGEAVGGLLNATFGNAAELIIALMALHKGLFEVVKASITGSIIGNILLVLGASILAGGLKHNVQSFNASGARVQSTSMTLATIALVMPAAFHLLASSRVGTQLLGRKEADLSLEISVVLLVTYGLGLLFSLRTHKQFFAGLPAEEAAHGPEAWSARKSMVVLGVATALIAWVSEMLLGSVEQTARTLGMSSVFVGVIVVAVVGNAAEHSTAILVAIKNRMDLSLGIAMGSSIQIALFVAPVLVLVSYFLGPQPMNLVFTPAEVLAVIASVWIAGEISADGECNWLEGVQLLAVYLILAFVFYALPEPSGSGR